MTEGKEGADEFRSFVHNFSRVATPAPSPHRISCAALSGIAQQLRDWPSFALPSVKSK